MEGLVYGLQNPNLGYSLYTLTVGRGVALAGGASVAKYLQIKAFLAVSISLLTFSYQLILVNLQKTKQKKEKVYVRSLCCVLAAANRCRICRLCYVLNAAGRGAVVHVYAYPVPSTAGKRKAPKAGAV